MNGHDQSWQNWLKPLTEVWQRRVRPTGCSWRDFAWRRWLGGLGYPKLWIVRIRCWDMLKCSHYATIFSEKSAWAWQSLLWCDWLWLIWCNCKRREISSWTHPSLMSELRFHRSLWMNHPNHIRHSTNMCVLNHVSKFAWFCDSLCVIYVYIHII